MKNPIFTFLLLALLCHAPTNSQACSCPGYREYFCAATSINNYTIRGRVSEILEEQKIRVLVDDVLNKEVPEDTITIYGQVLGNCLEDLTQFDIGDDLILALDKGYYTDPSGYTLHGNCGLHFLRINSANRVFSSPGKWEDKLLITHNE